MPQGKIFASCSHEVPSVDDLVPIRYGDEECDHDGFHRIVIYATWCRSCADARQVSGDLIETDEQEAAWLNGT